MKLRLLNLTLDNFKGIKHFALEPNGSSIDVFGDNATGKTTLADAYFWLLFGKDLAGRSDSNFDVKTRGTSGLDYSVEGTFLGEDGRQFILRRVYKEVFTRKNGEAEREYKGNTTDFFINGAPKPKKDYTAFIASICDEKIFMMITDPDMFAGKMKDSERREILLQYFAIAIDDREIINYHEELAPLMGFLGFKTTVDEYAEQTKYERQKINKQLAEIPGRIDEAEKAKPFDNLPTENDGPELLHLSKQKLQIESSISSVQNGETSAALRKKIADFQADVSTARANYLKKSSVGNSALEAEAAGLRTKINQLRNAISKNQAAEFSAVNTAESFEKELAELRQKCIQVAGQEFNHADGICPTCGRAYPPEQVHDLVDKFNEHNAQTLESLETKGKELKNTAADMVSAAEEHRRQIVTDQQLLKQAEDRLEQISKSFTAPAPFENTADYKKLQGEIESAERDLSTVGATAAKQAEKYTVQLKEVNTLIDAIKQRMTAKGIVEQQDKRITELKKQERELSQLLATYDKGLQLAEMFVQIKAQDIEQKVNSAFRLVRWKLFDTQINGGVKACCEATFKGIEYNKNLNNAAKLNAGLDIINTLGRAAGISVPVWIDNAESVTSYLPIDAQVIRLHVSARDKQLRAEVR